MNTFVNNKISMSVNNQGLISAMRKGFDSPLSIIKELAQNSRRANASSIKFIIDRELCSLSIIDDGKGIDDFSKLIGIYHSDWSEETKPENPYGIGFLSCLLAADSIIVKSNGNMLHASCEDILSFKEVNVVPCDTHGTSIQLIGEKIATLFDADFEKIFSGFDIPVFVDDIELSRPEALSSKLEFRECEAGKLWLGTTNTGSIDEPKIGYFGLTRLYYQGFYIGSVGHHNSTNDWSLLQYRANVLHLDITKYDAIAPDRHCLVNQQAVLPLIEGIIANAKKEDFLNQIEMQGEDVALNSYDVAKEMGLLSIYNNFTRVPRCLFQYFTEYPINPSNSDCISSPLEDINYHPSKEEIVSLKLPVFADVFSPDSEYKYALYCWKVNGIVFSHYSWHNEDTKPLDKNHWIWSLVFTPPVDDLGELDPSLDNLKFRAIEISKPEISTSSNALNYHILFCREYVIAGPYGDVLVDDHAVLTEGLIYFPLNDQSDSILLQSNGYVDEFDNFDHSGYGSDQEVFSTWLENARNANDPLRLISNILSEKIREFPTLHGKSFIIEIESDGKSNISLAP